jgi:hypothetical protein
MVDVKNSTCNRTPTKIKKDNKGTIVNISIEVINWKKKGRTRMNLVI